MFKVMLVAISGMVAVAGCVSTSHVLVDPAAPRYPALPADSVVIYGNETELADFDFVRIALIDASGGDDFVNRTDLLKAMRKKAAKLGANAIIVADLEEPPPAVRVAAAVFGVETERRGSVLAVRVLGRKQTAGTGK